jgi:hypothetical protein
MGNCLSVFWYRYVMLGDERIKLGEKMGREKVLGHKWRTEVKVGSEQRLPAL